MPNNKYNKRKRRVERRQVDKIVKECNYIIQRDDLWRGRFEVLVVDRNSFIYDDKSGVFSSNVITIVDNAEKDIIYIDAISHSKSCYNDSDSNWNRNRTFYAIMYALNESIVKFSDAWTSEHKPQELKDLPEYDFNKKDSYHMSKTEAIKRYNKNKETIWIE